MFDERSVADKAGNAVVIEPSHNGAVISVFEREVKGYSEDVELEMAHLKRLIKHLQEVVAAEEAK